MAGFQDMGTQRYSAVVDVECEGRVMERQQQVVIHQEAACNFRDPGLAVQNLQRENGKGIRAGAFQVPAPQTIYVTVGNHFPHPT
ncbi:hypothetical protein H920_08832 [Fukomys damarensis]|uniref:Uncharacterized protein n=1 Tax=Fukomys damarensis TaxID=885580 RepID=A0A091DF40_FUKDA|nr:hypothetical protein H920_08832 [Fukomys damarensis]